MTSICLLLAAFFPGLLAYLPGLLPNFSNIVLYILCSFFGLFTGAWIAATPSLIKTLLGPKKYAPAFGVLTVGMLHSQILAT